jgi:hypothetical protein
MKKNIIKCLVLSALFSLSACSDFFNVSTNNVLDGKNYIDEESEMYAGYIGIMTKVQAVGDKIIYLTDTRGELLEPTKNTPSDLYSIYNYETDLTGNAYANPALYYDVIIACNDYLSKLYQYKTTHPQSINMDHYKSLVSSTLRVKAWIYLTLVKIYGKAIWFDDALTTIQDISKYEVSDLDAIVLKCKNLLDTGFDGVNGTFTMSWKEWVDPETPAAESVYRYWDYMTPEYFALYAELSLWSGDYQKTVDLILNRMNAEFAVNIKDNVVWLRNANLGGKYSTFWNSKDPYAYETISAIIYDYTKNQTNSLCKHFGAESPNEYWLAPSEAGRSHFSDPHYNPLGTAAADPRQDKTFGKNSAGNYVVTKYRPLSGAVRTQPYQDDVQIYIYRGADLYFMLAEALNNLGRTKPASALINQGVNGSYAASDPEWTGFTKDWTSTTSIGTRKNPDLGMRGCFSAGLASRTFSSTDKKANDMAILNEIMIDMACEGRTYPAMIRMAKRYGDYSIIADRVCPKYGADSTIIRSKIANGGYFINWDLK